ncbi:MAG: VTC domain-containing protein [Actinomycetota bacterium]
MGPTESLALDVLRRAGHLDVADTPELPHIDHLAAIRQHEFDAIGVPRAVRDARWILSLVDARLALTELARSTGVGVLEVDGRRRFRRRSIHFDTDDLEFYRAALRRRPDRTKVRIREYPDAERAFVDVTVSDRHGRRTSRRTEIDPDHHDRLDIDACRFVDTALADVGTARMLRPTARTESVRTKLLDRVDGSRATLDTGYRCEELRSDRGRRTSALDGVIVEVTVGPRRSALAEHLRRRGVRPGRLARNAGVNLELRFERG